MQNYTEISEDKTLKDSRALLLDNDKTVMSNNSGTEFPTTNLQPGMLCFRTDLKKFYYLASDGTTWVEIINVSEDNGWVKRADTADNAEKVNDHTVNADVPVNAKFTDTTYDVATDSQAGLMTAAQKTKLDGLENFSLPVASADTLGGVKIGDGLSINSQGIVSSTVTGGNASHGSKLFTADGTFTVPEGVNTLFVSAIGGGGGGGGGGTMAGAHIIGYEGNRGRLGELVLFVTPGQSLPIKIGRGGTGGLYGNSPAVGSGGTGLVSGSAGTTKGSTGSGGGGGTTGINSIAIAGGGAGGQSIYATDSSTAAGGGGGAGGGSIYYNNPYIASTYGAGGSGSGTYNARGGTGTSGCVYIQW